MSAFRANTVVDNDDFDSDMSDEEVETGELSGWLDEEDPEVRHSLINMLH